MTDTQILHLFPTPIAVISYDCGDDVREMLDSIEMNTDTPKEITDKFGTMSKSTHVLDEYNSTLSEYILEKSKWFMQIHLALNIEHVRYTQSWLSYKKPGESHNLHSHPNSIVSGVYYYDSVDLDFLTPIHFCKPISYGANQLIADRNELQYPNAPAAWETYQINPIKNTLILFPSHLQHYVQSNMKEKTRKSLAFNVIPKDKFGNEQRLTELKLNE